MTTDTLKEEIRRALPDWMRTDPELRRFVLELAREESADRRTTEGRFEAMLAELARDREARERELEAQESKWEAQEAKWEAWERKWDEQTQAWNRHQEETWAEFRRMHEEYRAREQRFDRSVGALGARWGIRSERAFRDGLAAILEENFGVQVLNVNEYDEKGDVFGRPDQVELDVIIKNGLLILCELKSSIDKAGMYIFERKARFYEKRHDQTANRLIVISPMIDAKAAKVAERLGIETYGDSSDIDAL